MSSIHVLSLPLAATLALSGTALAQSAGDAPPSQPGNFRATLYDKAGGESGSAPPMIEGRFVATRSRRTAELSESATR